MRSFCLICLFLLCSTLLACDPIVMIPGGRLAGDVTPVPDDWSFTDATDTVQLETRPEDPYSVNVWALAVKDAIYVVAGSGRETTWAQNIEQDDRVRLRVGEAIYELRAIPDDEASTRDAFLAAAKKKYDFEPEGEDVSKAILYRLESR